MSASAAALIWLGDFPSLFTWWAVLFVIGLLHAPLCAKLFADWPDRGYPFAKPLGILLGGYCSWLLASLGIVPFGRVSAICITLIIGVVLLRTPESRKSLLELVQEHRRTLLMRELAFFALLVIFAFIRGQNPDTLGLEKFMDFGFVNACLRSPTMPPPDPWFAGATINYYYYGHFIAAWLIHLSGVASEVGYNLMMGTLFVFTCTLTFSLALAMAESVFGSDLRGARVAAGLVAAAMAAFGGNFHAFWKWFLPLIGLPFAASKSFYFPDSTRFIGYDPPVDDKTIHEFPFYSFVVSDLHGHVSNLPFVLLFCALLFAGWRRYEGKFSAIPLWPFFPLFALLFAVFSMTNMWDVPIYLLMLGFAAAFSFSKGCGGAIATRAAVIFLGFPALASPFTRAFKNFSHGVGLTFTHTPVVQFLVLWGGHLFFAVVFLVWFFRPGEGGFRPMERFRDAVPADRFCLVLIATAVCLLAIPEIVYVKDIYGRTFHRANTMFKLTYQAFLLLCIVAGFVFERIPRAVSRPVVTWCVRAAFSFMFAALLLYAIPALPQFYGGISLSGYKGLDGLRFMRMQQSGDAEAVEWLRANAVGQPAILEANGDSYTDYGRISMATGLPTPLGWFVHEWLWRGGSEPASARATDVDTMYRLENAKLVRELLRRYGIRYIIVGDLERQKFPQFKLDEFNAQFQKVFDFKGTRIFACPN
ncbi:MAG: hypothetical protein HQM09_18660 [Candidatus Riflebacteria bacterium]|nr:hypothetical protein [Candidatus Riflebacteria bacterium]